MESPAEKRARKLSAGPRRKRDTAEASSQERAFRGRRRRVPKEVKAEMDLLTAKLDEIKRYQEKLGLIHTMRDRIMAPMKEAESRLVRAKQEVEAAERALRIVHQPDLTDIETREINIIMAIDRLKDEAATLMAKFQKPVDSSVASP